jgi:hypothetical protein
MGLEPARLGSARPAICTLVALGLIGAALAGCNSRPAPEETVQPFVFKALNLRQQDGLGRPAWQIISPEARYDSSRRVAQARQISGTIYVAGKPLYRAFRRSLGAAFLRYEVCVSGVRFRRRPE